MGPRQKRCGADARRQNRVRSAKYFRAGTIRGKYLLENILAAPMPAPPPNIPTLESSNKTGKPLAVREMLEMHRANPACAGCHARMDPLGLSLENFDAIGQWRTEDGKFPIDPTGTLPDGRSFQSPDDLKAIFKADRNRFAECITEKMLIYALGRGVESYDRPALENIVTGLESKDDRFSALIMEVVNSVPFQMRRGEGDHRKFSEAKKTASLSAVQVP